MRLTLDLGRAGAWRFRQAGTRTAWQPATVPGCVHTDLHRLGLIPDPYYGTNELDLQWIETVAWEYKTEFLIDETGSETGPVDLVADGLDTLATVTLNGHIIARTDNMFLTHRWPVRSRLRRGRNVLHIHFASARDFVLHHRRGHRGLEFNDPIGGCTKLRKQQCQFGWDWGPRLVTAGIWRGLRLEQSADNRLVHVRVTQQHARNGTVTLTLAPELARPDPLVHFEGWVVHAGREVARIENLQARIVGPALWWPNGQGLQSLYEVTLISRNATGCETGRWTRRIGLRTVALERKPDRWGESFRFVVNGRAIFAKGANWIPAHSFVAGLSRADYTRDLEAAAQAHMNMIRVWGGGIYESEDFYDLCDELGLMVWQDFMFACSLYPGDRAFLRSVKEEARQQVRRLQHRACLALWCGNNEIHQLKSAHLQRPARQRAYQAIFHQILPAAVAADDGVTTYWPSSPWRGDSDHSPAAGEQRGDTHFWDVWHARHPVKAYEKWRFRFCSEFGMQSYSSPATNETFCPPGDGNLFGATMENHQKNPAGNQIILDYISRRYGLPKNQPALIYLSQLNQAHCMQTGVEHWRRNMPRCMGALYWQLNDCWPATSWSSLEFNGRWKALHHVARRFFAPLLLSAHVPGDETAGLGNYRSSTVRTVVLHTASDAPTATLARLDWELRHFDGRLLRRGQKSVTLQPGTSRRQVTLDFAGPLKQHGRDSLYLRYALSTGRRMVSEETALFSPPRFLALPRPKTRVSLRMQGAKAATLTFRSPVFQHRLAFDLPAVAHRCSDNWFDLYPGHTKTVQLDFELPQTKAALWRVLRWQSLADTVA
ncbi:MAG: Exo-beta-D-glucosaminidase precursor [Verrucomicrobiota bacterium]|jgi:beta-mannosidase